MQQAIAVRFPSIIPVNAAGTQDPSGHFVKEWVPEIARLPQKFLHQPWLAPSEVLAAAGITLGETYPQRITGSATLQVRYTACSDTCVWKLGLTQLCDFLGVATEE